ncbi:hypothetical protein CsSME_00028928 [Camellia sinensis var. sinensis]
MASASDFICQHLFDDFATDDYFTANLLLLFPSSELLVTVNQ